MRTSPEPGAAIFSLTHFRIRARARGRQATVQPPSKTKPGMLLVTSMIVGVFGNSKTPDDWPPSLARGSRRLAIEHRLSPSIAQLTARARRVKPPPGQELTEITIGLKVEGSPGRRAPHAATAAITIATASDNRRAKFQQADEHFRSLRQSLLPVAYCARRNFASVLLHPFALSIGQ
jgi:hypothetical protein